MNQVSWLTSQAFTVNKNSAMGLLHPCLRMDPDPEQEQLPLFGTRGAEGSQSAGP